MVVENKWFDVREFHEWGQWYEGAHEWCYIIIGIKSTG